MKVQKVVLVALVGLFSIGLTSCTKDTVSDELYEDAIEKQEIKDQDVD